MSDTKKTGMGFEINIRRKETKQPESSPNADTPFCIAVLGDFSAQVNQSPSDRKALSQRKLIEIDRDNFDDVLAKYQPSIEISSKDQPGNGFTIPINDLDDFHPDTLFEKLEIFSKLRSIRRRLNDKSSFDAAASEIMGCLVEAEQPEVQSAQTHQKDPANNPSNENLLDNVLSSTQQPTSELEYLTSPGGINQLIKDIITPYVEPATNPRQPEMIEAVDKAIEELMRQILHNPQFQSLEAAWRSVYFLISRIETGQQLKIYLLDVSKQELEEDLAKDLETSALHKLFCEPAMNDIQWSLLVGNYTFEDNINDVLLLSQLGSIAQCANAPFIAGAKSTLGGCESFGQYPDADDWKYTLKSGVENAWNMLRQSPIADFIGLALPRFLLRVPYGKKSSPIDAFQFEEITGSREAWHEHLLWGNAAFIKAEQLARAFNEKQWDMNPGNNSQTDSLPIHYYEDDGETQLMPCAEIYLTEKGGKKLSEQGLIPIWSVKNMDAVRSSYFDSLSEDSKLLQGRWVK